MLGLFGISRNQAALVVEEEVGVPVSPETASLEFWLNPRFGHTRITSASVEFVSQWDDSSYHNDNVQQTVAGRRPRWFVSGSGQNPNFIQHSFVEFSGSTARTQDNFEHLIGIPGSRITGSGHTLGIVAAKLAPHTDFQGIVTAVSQSGIDFADPGSYTLHTGNGGINQAGFNCDDVANIPFAFGGFASGSSQVHVLIATITATDWRVYVDNVLERTGTLGVTYNSTIDKILLAARQDEATDNVFRGGACQISEVLMYNVAFEGGDAGRRTTLYNYLTGSVSGATV